MKALTRIYGLIVFAIDVILIVGSVALLSLLWSYASTDFKTVAEGIVGGIVSALLIVLLMIFSVAMAVETVLYSIGFFLAINGKGFVICVVSGSVSLIVIVLSAVAMILETSSIPVMSVVSAIFALNFFASLLQCFYIKKVGKKKTTESLPLSDNGGEQDQ